MSGLVAGKKAAGKVARSAGGSRPRRVRAGNSSDQPAQRDNGAEGASGHAMASWYGRG